VKAPGTVELLGNHSHYHQGLVMSAAINEFLFMLSAPRTDGRIELASRKSKADINVIEIGGTLGEYQNVLHAKDILSMLFIQAGIPIVSKDAEDKYDVAFNFRSVNLEKASAFMALTFYTDFANPSKPLYSWNKSLKSSRDSFIAGETSIYFGYSSELPSIQLKNPNLNFDVAKVPQAVGAVKKSVFANVYGLAVLKSSKNQASSFAQIFTLVSKDSIATLSDLTNLPPVRKDVLVSNPSDLYMKIFYDSALIADTWPDPDQAKTEIIFKDMIGAVISGKSTPNEAVARAEVDIRKLITEINRSK